MDGTVDGRISNRSRDQVLEHYLAIIATVYDRLYDAMVEEDITFVEESVTSNAEEASRAENSGKIVIRAKKGYVIGHVDEDMTHEERLEYTMLLLLQEQKQTSKHLRFIANVIISLLVSTAVFAILDLIFALIP